MSSPARPSCRTAWPGQVPDLHRQPARRTCAAVLWSCSPARTAPTRRIRESPPGKIPTTPVLRSRADRLGARQEFDVTVAAGNQRGSASARVAQGAGRSATRAGPGQYADDVALSALHGTSRLDRSEDLLRRSVSRGD